MHDGLSRRGLFGAAGAYLFGANPASTMLRQHACNSGPGPLSNLSATLRWFIFRLGLCQDVAPHPWYDALADDIERQEPKSPPPCPSLDRRQAAFFAQLAVTTIVPHYLRYAGLPHLAASVRCPADLASAGRAIHDLIDAFGPVEMQAFEGVGWHPAVPPRHRAAYCAALHAGNACFAATSDDRYEFAGDWCGWALSSAFLDAENPISQIEFDCTPLWEIAASAIAYAQGLRAVDSGGASA